MCKKEKEPIAESAKYRKGVVKNTYREKQLYLVLDELLICDVLIEMGVLWGDLA